MSKVAQKKTRAKSAKTKPLTAAEHAKLRDVARDVVREMPAAGPTEAVVEVEKRMAASKADEDDSGVESSLDGRSLKDVSNDMLHHSIWAARCLHELHGEDGGDDERLGGLRTHVLALVALTEDVMWLRAKRTAVAS
jgi:hypothetical protein